MNYRKTARKALKYCAAFVMVFFAVTFSESTKAGDSMSPDNSFRGKTIRCVINTGSENYGRYGFKTGFSYEMLETFAKAIGAEYEISLADNHYNYIDSLKEGKIDIMILPDTCHHHGKDIILSRTLDNSVWAINSNDIRKLTEINTWIATYSDSGEYRKIWNRYHTGINPAGNPEIARKYGRLSPYDDIIRKYADGLGWDWRLLAALIYQESKFSIHTSSGRGAAGLMQVLPATARYYGVSDLVDPEENIKAGTKHLARLQKLYAGSEITEDERIKFILAAYNAGEGRIADCRNLAAYENLDENLWSDVVSVIPMMRADSTLSKSCVKLGKFNGKETIEYVDNVLRIYDSFCESCPS